MCFFLEFPQSSKLSHISCLLFPLETRRPFLKFGEVLLPSVTSWTAGYSFLFCQVLFCCGVAQFSTSAGPKKKYICKIFLFFLFAKNICERKLQSHCFLFAPGGRQMNFGKETVKGRRRTFIILPFGSATFNAYRCALLSPRLQPVYKKKTFNLAISHRDENPKLLFLLWRSILVLF